MITAITSALDAQLELGPARPSLAFLPNADRFAEIDLAIRLWASLRPGVFIREWGHRTATGRWIEGITVDRGNELYPLVTLHTPYELHQRDPEAPIRLDAYRVEASS